MATGVARRRGAVRSPVKREPGTARPTDNAAFAAPSSRDEDISLGTSMPVDQSFYRNERSDAPTPSERISESDPLFREVRAAPQPVVASPTSTVDESFFHNSFQDIGKKLKACNDTLGELQQLGVSHDVQLPELVLVGDQSAGKSSLMSGLANLDLPRSEGTCTRCPLHIRVSRNSDWSCRVWLRKEYSYQPPADRPIAESDVTGQDPFFPWRKRPVSSVLEFKTMHDKSQIEEVLRWAQVAILNDDKEHSLFVPGSGGVAVNMTIERAAEETVAKFSPNIVALEIKGPELPDLSFYDMPGIFQNPADAKDDYLVNVVRNLSKAYIQHPSAIIICSMPMNSDAENSSTFSLTRKLGASHRTIGVLTKADLLPEGGNIDQWLAIMKTETHRTGHGYFITSRPKGKDLEELKKWEDLFFGSHSIGSWPPLLYEFSDRCGVEKLKSYLSERLGEEFAKSLPNIKQKMRHHLDKIQRQLTALPELPNNVELEIQTGLMSFADCARDRLDDFVRHFNTLPRNFRDCLLEIKPKFTLKDKTDQAPIEISDDESEAGSIATNANTPSKRRSTAAATPSKRQRVDTSVNGRPSLTNGHVKPEEVSTNSLRSVSSRASSARRVVLPEPFTEFTDIGRGFRTLRQVREEIESKTQAGMPDRTSDEVYVDLVLEAVRPWNRPMDAYIRQATRDIQLGLESALNKSLESLKRRFIYQEAKKHLRQCISDHRKETEDALVLLYNDEVARLLTFNESAFKQYRDEEHMELTRFRHYMRMKGLGTEPGPYVRGELLTEDKRALDTKRREAEMLKLGPDQFAREIEVVAYVRGYYRLAALRFADAVSQRIICRMIPSLRRQLPRYLESNLGVGRDGNVSVYERLMEEDEATAAKRETLKLERNKFVKAMASIETLETGAPPLAVTVASGSSVSTSIGSVSVAETQREGMMAIDEVDEEEEV